jgi:hypothetical protein
MRALIAIVVACSLGACSSRAKSPNDLPAEAWSTADYVKAGVPAPDHTWSMAEHKTALDVLTKETTGHRERLPHRGGAKSGAVFERIVEPSPAGDELIVHAERFEVLNQVSKLYVADEKAVGATESYAITGRLLHEALALEVSAEAFLATFAADDPTRAAREAGFAKMREGWSEMLLGCLMMVSDYRAPEAAAVGLSRDLAAVLPTLYPRAEPGTKAKIKAQLDQMHRVFKDGALKAALPARL